MAHRQKHVAVEELRTIPRGIYASDVVDAVPVLLQPADRRILHTKDKVLGTCCDSAATRNDWTVVADGVGSSRVAAVIDAAVEIVPTPPVVGLPGRIGGLKRDVARMLIVTDDEWNHVLAERAVETRQLRKV